MLMKALRDDIDSDEGCARETCDRLGGDDGIEDWPCDTERRGS